MIELSNKIKKVRSGCSSSNDCEPQEGSGEILGKNCELSNNIKKVRSGCRSSGSTVARLCTWGRTWALELTALELHFWKMSSDGNQDGDMTSLLIGVCAGLGFGMFLKATTMAAALPAAESLSARGAMMAAFGL
eukprot:g43619.t1